MHYLYGEKFDVFTNHQSLKYLFSQNELNLRERQCEKHMKDYDLGIRYPMEKRT